MDSMFIALEISNLIAFGSKLFKAIKCSYLHPQSHEQIIIINSFENTISSAKTGMPTLPLSYQFVFASQKFIRKIILITII